MDKRYQVFISSTYMDLQEERAAVSKEILELNDIPVGMEGFGAADEEQMQFIKKIIDQTDYYVLILGGRYGTIEPTSGKSYTHLEYDYAVSQNVPVMVFAHSDKERLPKEKRDTDPEQIEKLNEFIAQVTTSRLRDSWNDKVDLCLKVVKSLEKEKRRIERPGWVPANKVASEEVLKELNELRKENDELRKTEKAQKVVQDFASLTDKVEVRYLACEIEEPVSFVPSDFFFHKGLEFRSLVHEDKAVTLISEYVDELNSPILAFHDYMIDFSEHDAFRVLYHFRKHGILEQMGENYWGLTEAGSEYLADQLAFKKTEAK